MTLNLIDKIITHLQYDNDFALIPYNPSPNKESKRIFDAFIIANKKILIDRLFIFGDYNLLSNTLSIISHYKGIIDIEFDDDSLEFIKYKQFIIPNIYNNMIIKYHNELLEIIDYLDENHKILILDIIIKNDITTYIDISLKYNIGDIKKIWKYDRYKVFVYINKHNNKYDELKKLNQPQFILENLNGRLDTNNDTLRYFFEYISLNTNILKTIKQSTGLHKIYKYISNNIDDDELIGLIESIDDVKFIINKKSHNLGFLNILFKTLEKKYPYLKEYFSLLLIQYK